MTKDQLTQALCAVFESPNETDSNFENANVVDGLFAIARSINKLAKAVERTDISLPEMSLEKMTVFVDNNREFFENFIASQKKD